MGRIDGRAPLPGVPVSCITRVYPNLSTSCRDGLIRPPFEQAGLPVVHDAGPEHGHGVGAPVRPAGAGALQPQPELPAAGVQRRSGKLGPDGPSADAARHLTPPVSGSVGRRHHRSGPGRPGRRPPDRRMRCSATLRPTDRPPGTPAGQGTGAATNVGEWPGDQNRDNCAKRL